MDITVLLGIISVIILIALVVALVLNSKNKGTKKPTNYRVLFILGLVWLPICLLTKNNELLGAGLVFIIIGLANKNKWADEKKWSDLTPKQKKVKLMVVFGLTMILLAGLLVIYLAKSGFIN